MKNGLLGLLAGLFPFGCGQEPHPLRLAPIFSDHAVLQPQQPIRIWGWGRPAASVAVRLDTFRAQTTAMLRAVDWSSYRHRRRVDPIR